MAIVSYYSERPLLSKEQMAALWEKHKEQLRALDDMPDDDIDYSDIPEMTDEDWARSVRVSDYPSIKEARATASRLCEMQKAGATVEELESYKASRIKELTDAQVLTGQNS